MFDYNGVNIRKNNHVYDRSPRITSLFPTKLWETKRINNANNGSAG